MSNCVSLTLTGIAQECAKPVGGIKKVYIALRDDVKDVSLNADGSAIEKIEMNSDAVFFHTYDFHKNTGSLTTETDAPDDSFPLFNTTLSLVFSKMDTAKRVEMMALALEDTVAIVETVEGTKFYLGYNMGLLISALGAESGTLYSDNNQYTISLVDHAEQLPYPVTMDISTIVKEAPVA